VDEPRLDHVIALFEQALSVPPEQRPEFVRQVSGENAALRHELSSLLDAEGSAAEYFDDLADHVVSPAYAALAGAGTVGPRWEGRRVGAYRLVREIGRGGMSRVFLAERSDGEFERQVALKLLRPGFDSDIDVMRFRAERQILATLDHPNIARLLDGGVTDDALPYLVLEYIDGVPIDRYCDSRGLSTPQRLELFLSIADAVEYAHRNSVVHRDLKPSNILVTSDGTVKLLDFGVAKLLEQQVPGARPTTRTTHRWMTPDYAAPEQIRGKGITPRTDVYQLGAALYELLAGRTPFDRCGDTIHELERAILEQDPDSLGQTLGADLDAIVGKALRKNPDERYASAIEFADDVRRHLTGHPVHARRQTLGYRTRRFAYRNRLRLAAAAGLVALLMTAVITVRIDAARSRRALAELTSRVGVADSLPTFATALLALSAGKELTDTAPARALVQKGVTYARAASRQPQRRAQVLEAAGIVQTKLREYDSAFALLQEALVIRRRLADTRRGGGRTVASSSSTPTVAPDPRRRPLLFSRPPGIVFMVDEDGSHEVRITDPSETDDAPAWAPDGRRVLFSRMSGARGIYVINPDGTDLTPVTAPPPGWVDCCALAFGSQIVFNRTDDFERNMIYRVNVDGTGLTRLTSGLRDASVVPSPNGDFIVFARDGDIYRRDLPRGTETRLTNTPAQYKGLAGVSPDGRTILFTRIDPGRFEQIFVMHVDGTHVRRISRGDYYDFLPRWSPDGTRIAFTSSRDGTNGVYTMRADGSDVRDVSRTPLTLAMRPRVTVLQVNESVWAWR
jgi:dipeptidyl aminopeptidase/acylaminoacyl peptidase